MIRVDFGFSYLTIYIVGILMIEYLMYRQFKLLQNPGRIQLLTLHLLQSGVLLSREDGTKQENAVYTALQQLANAFVPYCLRIMYEFYLHGDEDEHAEHIPPAAAVVPMIVTNAKIFRLKPDIIDLDLIRSASSPDQIANEVDWTWVFHDPPMSLVDQNWEAINKHENDNARLIYQYPQAYKRMQELITRPNWIIVANIRNLENVVKSVSEHFSSLKTFSTESRFKKKRAKSK